jgi:hypothetical protein
MNIERGALMSTLPSTDLGLMAEHLTAHEGEINKLQIYARNVPNNGLKKIINLQINMLKEHVRVMLALVKPNQAEYVELASLEKLKEPFKHSLPTENEHLKWITLEAHNTARTMSNVNYASALMMKNQNVRKIHVQMALQELEIQRMYETVMKKMGWGFVPHASKDSQEKTYQYYEKTFESLLMD